MRSFKKYKFKQLENSIFFLLSEFKSRIRPKGVCVVLLGTDGSGKSTISNKLLEILSDLMRSGKNEVVHWRPGLLPAMKNIFRPSKWKKEGEAIVTNPHGSETSNFFGSLIRVLYYTIDFVIGYYLKTYNSLRKNALIIFDRYYYDFLIDSKRSRVILPHWIINTIGVIIPKPNIILCLGTDAKTIHARKPELPLEEVKRQVAELKEFCAKNKRAVWIDTGCSMEESINKALEAITSRMAARYEKK